MTAMLKMMTPSNLLPYFENPLWASFVAFISIIILAVCKALYNISQFHPLARYPGPLLWRASRLFASYHHARGDLYQHIAAIHDKYGPTVRFAPDELSFTNPEAWAQIYNSRPQLAKSRYHFGSDSSDRLPQSMITASDSEHMRLRRLTGPAFLNSGIFEVEPVLQHYADLLCRQLAVAGEEGPQDIGEWFLWTLNDVIGQLALDQEFDCLNKRRMHPWPAFLMKVLKTSAITNQFERFGLSLKVLQYFMSKESKQNIERFFALAFTAITTRLASTEDETTDRIQGKKKRPDMVGLMMRELKGETLSIPEITANSILIVGGGAETTSTCLSATIYHLCKTPRVMQKLQKEIRKKFATAEDISLKATASLPYLVATIEESLRIFPVASYITPRFTPKGGHLIDGHLVSAGTYVSMGQWYMGRSERFFDDPQDFRPERWLGSSRRPDDILKPFSLGPRNCVGKLLAVAEARLVIAKLLWHFDIALDGDHSTWVQDARFYVLWELQPLRVHLSRAYLS